MLAMGSQGAAVKSYKGGRLFRGIANKRPKKTKLGKIIGDEKKVGDYEEGDFLAKDHNGMD